MIKAGSCVGGEEHHLKMSSFCTQQDKSVAKTVSHLFEKYRQIEGRQERIDGGKMMSREAVRNSYCKRAIYFLTSLTFSMFFV